jgi:hypothetical protein
MGRAQAWQRMVLPPMVRERGSAWLWVAWEPRGDEPGVGSGRVERGVCEGASAGLSLTAMVGMGVGADFRMAMVGGDGSTEIVGMFGMALCGGAGTPSGKLIIGIGGIGWACCLRGGSSSGKLMIGIDEICGGGRGTSIIDIGLAGLKSSFLFSSGALTSLGRQFGSKLTIGRPGLSDTMAGVGSFGLRSFQLMLVAWRISSPLISFPSFIFATS